MAFHPDELRGTHGRWAAGGRHRAVNRISVRQTEKRQPAPVAERPRRTESQANKKYRRAVDRVRQAHSARAADRRGEKLRDRGDRAWTSYPTDREAVAHARLNVQRPLHLLGPRVRAKRSASGKAYLVRGWEMTDEDEHGQFQFYGRRTRVANLGGKKADKPKRTVKRARDLMR